MKKQLTREQFIAFIRHLWGNYWADKMQENLWAGIAGAEANRSFDEGWDYIETPTLLDCESRLSMTAAGDDFSMVWDYCTTSGTEVHVWQNRETDYDSDDEKEPEFTITIPEDRAVPGRDHYDALQAILEETKGDT